VKFKLKYLRQRAHCVGGSLGGYIQYYQETISISGIVSNPAGGRSFTWGG